MKFQWCVIAKADAVVCVYGLFNMHEEAEAWIKLQRPAITNFSISAFHTVIQPEKEGE